MQITRLRTPGLVAIVQMVAATAYADIDLRVESRPMTGAIEAFVRVTEGTETVTGLKPADFVMTLDGRPLSRFGFRLPVDQDPDRSLSVVVVLADGRATESAIPAIARLPAGTFVAILRVSYQAGDRPRG